MEKFLNKKKVLVFLTLILFIGSILRLWQLGSVPISLNWDEVALGYDAYSISLTGKDEYGKYLPTVLRSFDDYKPALYAYLIIPTYKIFGLNAFAVRLPSAIFGILTILAVFLLIRRLFKRDDIALLTSFILAISPWHIQFSRIAFESNIGLALNVFAATLFVYGLKRPWLLIFSALCAGLSLHVYQSEKVFTPLFMLGLILIYRKEFFAISRKYIFGFVLAGLLVALPLALNILMDEQVLLRAKGTSIFNNRTQVLKQNAQRNIYNIQNHNQLGKIFDNRRIVYTKEIINGYLSHFSPNWLLRGDIARHHAPGMGLIYMWEFPFILIGIYALILLKIERKTKFFIFFWFLLAPIPASITSEVPHAVRTLNFLPTWQLFSSLGIITAISFIINSRFKRGLFLLSVAIFLFAVFNFFYYLNQYFVQQNYFFATDWLYGYEKIVGEVKKKEKNYKKIIVSDKQPMDKSYMFFLFYLKYDPSKYQISGQKSGGYAQHHKFDKYEFRPIIKGEDDSVEDVLFVGLPEEFSSKSNVVYKVNYPNGKPSMMLVGK